MPSEIERKFLVKRKRLPADLGDGIPYLQGYMSRKPAVRVRIAETARPEAWLTIKGKGDIVRAEFEYPIPPEDARELMKLCQYTLTKVRHFVKVADHVWEIDRFTGAHDGLWLAEIELTREDEQFEMPDWLGQEVSSDPRYTNASLAEMGRYP